MYLYRERQEMKRYVSILHVYHRRTLCYNTSKCANFNFLKSFKILVTRKIIFVWLVSPKHFHTEVTINPTTLIFFFRTRTRKTHMTGKQLKNKLHIYELIYPEAQTAEVNYLNEEISFSHNSLIIIVNTPMFLHFSLTPTSHRTKLLGISPKSQNKLHFREEDVYGIHYRRNIQTTSIIMKFRN